MRVLGEKARRFLRRRKPHTEPAYPFLGDATGRWRTTTIRGWATGFFPGLCHLLNDCLPGCIDPAELEPLLGPMRSLEGWANSGVRVLSTFIPHPLMPPFEPETARKSARKWAAFYSPSARIVGKPENTGELTLLVDWLYDINLLLEADPESEELRDIARAHIETCRGLFLREDGSCFQEARFEAASGKFLHHVIRQGRDIESNWSRGQAWAVYGFSRAAFTTGDREWAAAARKTAGFYLDAAGTSALPPWDFDVSGGEATITDSSAAALACAGLQLLSRLSPEDRETYGGQAEELLDNLLHPNVFESDPDVEFALLHGAYHRHRNEIDQATIWGDFFLAQAISLSIA